MTAAHTHPTWRARAHHQLEPSAWHHAGLSPVNKVVITLISLSVAIAVLESEPEIAGGHEHVFLAFDLALGVLFALEYAARVWASAENPAYGPGWRGRLRYVVSPAAIFDLLAVAPVFLLALGDEAFMLRLVRLLRVLRLARLGRFSGALVLLSAALRSRRYELMISMVMAVILLLVTSTLLYLVEGSSQPEAFGSIPRAMWWSVATLTTVGYGDVYPYTPLGKVLAGLTALLSIGLIAMPTGIVAAAFSDALQQQRHRREHGKHGDDAT